MTLWDSYTTIVEAFQSRAVRTEQVPALRYLVSGDIDGPIVEWHFRDLDRRARHLGGYLQGRGLVGERVLLIYPPGLDFIAAFTACLYAGVIAVPLSPPSPADIATAISRTLAIAKDCGATIVLTTDSLLHLAAPMLPQVEWVATDLDPGETTWSAPAIAPRSIAFLQYTSGSTGEPKGVVIGHDNLWFNVCAIQRAYAGRHTVSWLPTYHDMGLIGSLLMTLAEGATVTLLAPHEFLRKPSRWMRAISHYRADRTVGPNFSYMLAAQKSSPQERAGLDLSCLHTAIVGAEPISPRMISAFVRTFGDCGFDPRAFAPAFGLAEATLLVSTRKVLVQPVVRSFHREKLLQNRAATVEEGGTTLVGSGSSIPGQQIVIVDPERLTPCADGRVGEILINGPSVAKGYWGRPNSQAETFQCRIEGSSKTFLRTGDLGFLLDGELFVTGRIKDLIIIRGKNHAPSDIENTLEREHTSFLRPGRIVAASIETEEDSEGLLVLAEIREEKHDNKLMRSMARSVVQHHGIDVHTIVLLPKGAIPLTSSGKLRRRAARDAFLAKTLPVRAAYSPERDPTNTESTRYYRSLDEIRERLDKRATTYRFDLERDLPWDRSDEPGQYVPTRLLDVLGIDSETLSANPEAFDMFQWAAALSICRTFELLEWGIIQFCRREKELLGNTQSIDNLCEEEEKHIRLFRRLTNLLERKRPELVGAFEESFRESYAFLRSMFDPASGKRFHMDMWLDALVFEPFSLYLAHALASAPEAIQPLWLRAHQLHAREEAHHVVTVDHYAQALELDTKERERFGHEYLGALRQGFDHLFGIAAPIRLVAQRWPQLCIGRRASDAFPEPFVRELATAKQFAPLRRALPAIASLDRAPSTAKTTNAHRPEVVFLLSSERAGSTLLRIMLSGHPELFSPPELNLLGFRTLSERAERLPTGQQDGLPHAWVELFGQSKEEADVRVEACCRDHRSIFDVYEELIEKLSGRMLVDKSPLYSRDLDALKRAEAHFGNRARYVFLTRHPYSVIESYARIGLKRLSAELPQNKDDYELGEMGWTLSNRTVRAFLEHVEPERYCYVRFEDLSRDPRGEIDRICDFLGIAFRDEMLDPYQYGRMVEDLRETSLVGDPNFRKHQRIKAERGDAWQTIRLPKRLGPEARRVAAELGYELPHDTHIDDTTPLAPLAATIDIRAIVVRTLAQATGVAENQLHDDTKFVELGLNSLQIVRVTDVLERELGRPLEAMTLYNRPCIGDLLAFLTTGKSNDASIATSIDLSSEVWLDDDIRPAPGASFANGGAPFLTGTTGFLGAYLLRGLIDTTDERIYCLVRTDDEAQGLNRIRKNLTQYGIWDEHMRERIVVVRGDLSLPRFGLDAGDFDGLSEQIGVIYSNGARLRFDQDYEAHRAANVAGTRDILWFATRGRVKHVHHVSSLAVLDGFAHRNNSVDERAPMDSWEGIHLGYAQSKWVSERIVSLAGERGIPVTIFRAGGIAGHSKTGAWNTDDLVCRFLKGCISMGLAPRVPLILDLAPVDYVAEALLWLSRRPEARGAIYHLNHARPITWSRLVAWMRFQGYSLEEVDYATWLSALTKSTKDADHPLATLVPYFTRRLPHDGLTHFEARQYRPNIHCERTTAAFVGDTLSCPPLGHDLLETWFGFMIRQGFLPQP